jgi:hypothetical protein
MSQRALAAEAAQSKLMDLGYEIFAGTEESFSAAGEYHAEADFCTTQAIYNEQLDVLVVIPPEDMNGERYLAVFVEELDEVYFIPTDEVPGERFVLALDNQPTAEYLEASRFAETL